MLSDMRVTACVSPDYMAVVFAVRDGILRWLVRERPILCRNLQRYPMHRVYIARLEQSIYQAMQADVWLENCPFDAEVVFEDAFYQVLTLLCMEECAV